MCAEDEARRRHAAEFTSKSVGHAARRLEGPETINVGNRSGVTLSAVDEDPDFEG